MGFLPACPPISAKMLTSCTWPFQSLQTSSSICILNFHPKAKYPSFCFLSVYCKQFFSRRDMWRFFPLDLTHFPVALITLQMHRLLYPHNDQRLFYFVHEFFCNVHVLLWSNSPSHSTCHDFQNKHNLPAAWWAVTVQSQPNMKQGSSNYRRTNRRMNEWMDWTGLGAGDRKSVAFRFYGRTLAALQRGV